MISMMTSIFLIATAVGGYAQEQVTIDPPSTVRLTRCFCPMAVA